MPPRLKPATVHPALVPPRPDDQLRVVAVILATGLARLLADRPILSDSCTNELAVSAHKSVTVPDA